VYHRVQCWALMNMVMNLQVPFQEGGEFLDELGDH
jgi:hypothetical protein